MRNDDLENLILREHIAGKSRRKQWMTLGECMGEWDVGQVKSQMLLKAMWEETVESHDWHINDDSLQK